MIGLIIATCIAAHDCQYEIVESKTDWKEIEDCVIDSPQTLLDLSIVPARNQHVICDELR